MLARFSERTARAPQIPKYGHITTESILFTIGRTSFSEPARLSARNYGVILIRFLRFANVSLHIVIKFIILRRFFAL